MYDSIEASVCEELDNERGRYSSRMRELNSNKHSHLQSAFLTSVLLPTWDNLYIQLLDSGTGHKSGSDRTDSTGDLS